MPVYPISANTALNVIAFVHLEADGQGELKENWKSLASREQLLKDMTGFEEQAMGILRLMLEQAMRWKLNDQDPFEPWVFAKARIVLFNLGEQGGRWWWASDGRWLYVESCLMGGFFFS